MTSLDSLNIKVHDDFRWKNGKKKGEEDLGRRKKWKKSLEKILSVPKDETMQDASHLMDKTVKKSARSLRAVGRVKGSSLESHTSL
ncbi:hypothetical protein Pcinc_042468 [Petrolisthes cinctipes]|uniref:Uncharacterized protein n=1 Tax=Petrolisthes cinctipes TaxID=88211 RepID=A0AAE1BJX0_PETCI|nr:hypothetical protein Pcinc_042468 [Petrolisthes cinctipes]